MATETTETERNGAVHNLGAEGNFRPQTPSKTPISHDLASPEFKNRNPPKQTTFQPTLKSSILA